MPYAIMLLCYMLYAIMLYQKLYKDFILYGYKCQIILN